MFKAEVFAETTSLARFGGKTTWTDSDLSILTVGALKYNY